MVIDPPMSAISEETKLRRVETTRQTEKEQANPAVNGVHNHLRNADDEELRAAHSANHRAHCNHDGSRSKVGID